MTTVPNNDTNLMTQIMIDVSVANIIENTVQVGGLAGATSVHEVPAAIRKIAHEEKDDVLVSETLEALAVFAESMARLHEKAEALLPNETETD